MQKATALLLCYLANVSGKGLLLSESNVVSLNRKAQSFHIKNESLELWTDNLLIRNMSFTCSLLDSAGANRARALQLDLRSKLIPTERSCFGVESEDLGQVNFCPNDRVEFGGRKFMLSEQTTSELQTFTDSSSQESIHFKCSYSELPQLSRTELVRMCRLGSVVDGEHVITNMFTNGTVSLQSVRSSSRHAARKSLAEIASSCDSLGIADENPNQFLEIVSVSSTEIRANSNLCYTGHAANPIDLLRPLSHACLTGAFNHRHFEVCLTEPEAEFRLIQPTHRMNHPWPTALPMTGLSEANWTFDVARRSLQRKFKTNQGCKRLQPALTEEFTVTVMISGRLSLKAVSGSFSPMVFPSNFIEGVLHHDPRHENGCSSNAFESGTPKEPWIALVDRGGCMFQDKALVAQAKGAAGVIVINNNRKGMIPAMAAIVGKPVVDIPTVLTDVDGAVLRKHIGTRVQIAPASLEGHPSPSEDDKLHVSLRIGCRSIEEGYSRSCQVGDEVLAQFDGDLLKHPVQIIQKLNPDSYIVKSTSGSHETAMGYQLFRDSNSPCTVQLGSFIEAIERTDTCELVVDIHSALLCGDSRFREPLFKKNDIECTLT